MTSSELIEPTQKAMGQMQRGPLADYLPFTRRTEGVLRGFAALESATLAVMHGSSYIGKSGKLLADLAGVIKESFDASPSQMQASEGAQFFPRRSVALGTTASVRLFPDSSVSRDEWRFADTKRR